MPFHTRSDEVETRSKLRYLLDLHQELTTYCIELESRIQQDKPYNFFGLFLQKALGFSEDTLQKRGIFTATAKKPLAERLLRAVNFAIDGTIIASADKPLKPSETPVGSLSRAILNGGRLGALTARLNVYQGVDLYEAMLRRKALEPKPTCNEAMLRRKAVEPKPTYNPLVIQAGVAELERLAAKAQQAQISDADAQSAAPRPISFKLFTAPHPAPTSIASDTELGLSQLSEAARRP